MHKVLVPLDGSAQAAVAIPAAAAFARAVGSELLLLRVVEPEQAHPSREAAAQVCADAQREACAYLEEMAATVRGPDLSVTITTAVGHPTTRIVETIHRDPLITNVALAAHGAGGDMESVFGRTAEEVLRTAGVPVLLVRGEQTPLPLAAGGVVLVPFDNSAFALQALHEAETLAAAAGATLLLVWVLPPLDYPSQVGGTASWRIEAGQREANRITGELEQIARRMTAAGLPVRIQVAQGQPADEIAGLATASGAALIVMAAYGQSALHWGNVALGVMRLAAMPILLPAMSRTRRQALEDDLGLTARAGA